MRYIRFLILLLLNAIHAAKSHLDLAWAKGSIKNRSSRDVSCREGMEYEHDNICCLNCPAGTYVKKACLTPSEKGVCEPCEFDRYTEHDNGLRKCLSCTKCRIDQETTEKCTNTQNTQCKCKQGSFCLPDQACEVCKKCSRCREDEEAVKSCTDISNTVCRKRSSLGSSNSVTFIVVVAFIAMLAFIVGIVYWTKSKQSKKAVTSRSPRKMVRICMGDSEEVKEESQNAHNSKMDDSSQLQPFLEQNYAVGTNIPASAETEKDRGLGDSLPNTANSSQISLVMSAVPSDLQFRHTNQPPSSATALQPHTLEGESIRRLVPLNGEESLKKSFDFFEEMDVHYHNRFFRFIGLSDNSIKSAESLFPEDRVYELLKIWMEKEGLEADFNSLIEALIYLDQRLSAENIIAKAIINGYFKYEDE
ncbi:tumor necrosis factor receptor superfamily member 10A-like isoform X1 [Sinocyclocheilus rhinocerous]|uniref:tumor necrosis factor receptor superfamily member 10A-like isoform X1 n=1 Tax=Sinocyclocheilus rhinocerous TaxID=307959 RepID=UPI0007B9C2F5|nr:PREDICTED: tumor necrosis factor receptor superfamily member 10A-like isoform X1 [Sinocyclocheilus rhinocerous]